MPSGDRADVLLKEPSPSEGDAEGGRRATTGSGNHESRVGGPRQNGSRLGPGESEKKMKKAMFGLACAAAMVVCADITSSNIVGYNNKDACANYSLGIPMFNEVCGTGMDLQKIVPVGENVSGTGDITLQTFTDEANSDEVFSWFTEADMGFADGWYNDSFELAEKTFAPGEGFMLGAAAGAIQLNFAGEVNLAEKIIDCGANYSLLGNFRPVSIDLQSIVPQGDNVSGTGDITLQTFTDEANSDEVFSWFTEADMGFADGWYNDSFELAEKTFAPGEGFMLGAASGAIQLKFPAMGL